MIRADNIQAGDPIPGIGVSKELTDAVAPLRKGEMTAGPIVLPGNKIAVASVTDYQPAHQATFEEAKADVRNKASQEKLQKILTGQGQRASAPKRKPMGGDLEKAAKEMGIEVKTSTDVDRQGASKASAPASTVPDAFTKPVGALFGPVCRPGRPRWSPKWSRKIPADLGDLPAQIASIRDRAAGSRKPRDRTTLFEDGLKKRLEDEGKLKDQSGRADRAVLRFSNGATRSPASPQLNRARSMHAIVDFLKSLYNAERLLELARTLLRVRSASPGLFGIVFAETGLLVGFFLPGDSLLFSVGFASGAAGVNLYLLAGMLMCAAIIGDNVGYFLGHTRRPAHFQPPAIAFLSSGPSAAHEDVL